MTIRSSLRTAFQERLGTGVQDTGVAPLMGCMPLAIVVQSKDEYVQWHLSSISEGMFVGWAKHAESRRELPPPWASYAYVPEWIAPRRFPYI